MNVGSVGLYGAVDAKYVSTTQKLELLASVLIQQWQFPQLFMSSTMNKLFI